MNSESAYYSKVSFGKQASGIGPQRQLHPCYLSSSRYVCAMDNQAITRTLAFIGTVQHPAVHHEKWRGELIALSHASMFIVHQPPDRMTVAVTLALSGLISSSATWGLALESTASAWPLLRLPTKSSGPSGPTKEPRLHTLSARLSSPY